ncbi:MAG: thrombospondin type-1 domain-containing protein [Candidatus Woesearchaeota archaeon]|nr:MAG: thrombospondin type-1 domain-containing protein [Candidatus Woesearchaeota archaeon]
MNVISKGFLFLCVLLFCAGGAFAFSVCNVDISEPWFVVTDSSGIDVFIVDSQGDTYFEGRDHSLNNQASYPSFVVGSGQYYNSVTSKFGPVSERVASLGAGDGLVVRNAVGVDVAKFADSSVSTKGAAVYEGSQAGCSPDGVYCRSAAVEDTRNYFCDLTASKTGVCTYSVLSSRSCNTLDYYYCSGSTQYRRQLHTCADSQGGCYPSSSVLIQTCTAPATSYGSWSCYSQTSRVRTNIVYSPTCSSAGGCGISSTSVQDVQSCPSGNYCNGGSCYSYSYAWKAESWGSCSVSCGGGTQTRDVYCEQSSGGLYAPSRVADSYCSGAKPATSQSCNTQVCCYSHDSYRCYNGDIWYYDSCGAREDVKDYCSFTCSSGKTRCDYRVSYSRSYSQYWACKPCGGSDSSNDPVPYCVSPSLDTSYNCGSGYTSEPACSYTSQGYYFKGICSYSQGATGSCSDPVHPGHDTYYYTWYCRSNY